MNKHETALTDGQMAEFVGAGTKALILVANKLGPDLAGNWAKNGAAMERTFLGVFLPPEHTEQAPLVSPPALPQYLHVPNDDEVFELTINGDEVGPLKMVSSDGYDAKKWTFVGQKIVGIQTRRFKLVRVMGDVFRNYNNANENSTIENKLEHLYGKHPEGQWREAFKKKFPRSDGRDPIGFADPSWKKEVPSSNSFGSYHDNLPCLRGSGELSDWRSDFVHVYEGKFTNWRWLVPASK